MKVLQALRSLFGRSDLGVASFQTCAKFETEEQVGGAEYNEYWASHVRFLLIRLQLGELSHEPEICSA
jgi:hypothetical protein